MDLGFLLSSFQFSFFAAIIAGILGTLVMINRLNYLSSGFSHASLGGIGIAVFVGYSINTSIIVFAFLIGLWVAYLYSQNKERLGSYIDILSAFGMAFGSALIQLSPGTPKDYSAFLFGSLLLVSPEEVGFLILITFFVLAYMFFSYRGLVAVSFDREFAATAGISVKNLERMLILILAVALPFLVRTLGLTLTLSLLTFSPLIFESTAKNIGLLMLFATIANLFFLVLGIASAYYFDLPVGTTASILATSVFFLFMVVRNNLRLLKARSLVHRPKEAAK